jgi:hypothetical protein
LLHEGGRDLLVGCYAGGMVLLSPVVESGHAEQVEGRAA